MSALSLFILACVSSCAALVASPLQVIPHPADLQQQAGEISLPSHIVIEASDKQLASLQHYTGETLKTDHQLSPPPSGQNPPPASYRIILSLDRSASPHNEGYQLESQAEQTHIRAPSAHGLFNGVQTLRQLITRDQHGHPVLAKVLIRDQPSHAWRGMHLDVSRHFFTKQEIKRYLDHLASYKMNVFHWHLVDGPGWRLKIKKYPKLTEVGAWRKNKTASPWNWQATEIHPDGKQAGDYGGYYSRQDIREIVAYAKQRFITVVPEIEMPGHSYAALVAYPHLACPGNNIRVHGLRGKDVFCIGNPDTFQFLRDILQETLELFPSPYIHIGADEVPHAAWAQCPRCQAFKKQHQLTRDQDLQTALVRQMENYLHSQGRRMIGWDEILNDQLPERATVMVWRDAAFARQALANKQQLIMSPGSHCYFDQYQSQSRKLESPAIGGFLPTRKVYDFSPVPDHTSATQRALILGGQGNVWTEYIQNMSQLETRIFPRMCALAETLWTPPGKKSWPSFEQRIDHHRQRWQQQGVHFFKGSLDGQ